MALRKFASSFTTPAQTGRIYFAFSESSLFHTSSSLSRELTEGTPTTRQTQSGFVGKLKKGVTNLVTRQQDTSELTQEQGVDRDNSPEAHPFPEERGGSIYTQAQWQDDGVVHDVKPNGQGIRLSSSQQATVTPEKDLASA